MTTSRALTEDMGTLSLKAAIFPKCSPSCLVRLRVTVRGRAEVCIFPIWPLECLARMALWGAVHPSPWVRPSPIGFGGPSKYQWRFLEMGRATKAAFMKPPIWQRFTSSHACLFAKTTVTENTRLRRIIRRLLTSPTAQRVTACLV